MDFDICEVNGQLNADILHEFNALMPTWPKLEHRHLKYGYWWLALDDVADPVAFAGLVPMEPFPNIGYLKRCYVKQRGHGLQFRMMMARELKARQLGWTMLVSECDADNEESINNFRRAGFAQADPEQRWGIQPALYWVKAL